MMRARWCRYSVSAWRSARPLSSMNSACPLRSERGPTSDCAMVRRSPKFLTTWASRSSARSVVESVFTGPRSYVEIVAGCHRDGQHASTEVGMSIVDTTAGRVLVSPSRAFDGEWISTFSPGNRVCHRRRRRTAHRPVTRRPLVRGQPAVPRFQYAVQPTVRLILPEDPHSRREREAMSRRSLRSR